MIDNDITNKGIGCLHLLSAAAYVNSYLDENAPCCIWWHNATHTDLYLISLSLSHRPQLLLA